MPGDAGNQSRGLRTSVKGKMTRLAGSAGPGDVLGTPGGNVLQAVGNLSQKLGKKILIVITFEH